MTTTALKQPSFLYTFFLPALLIFLIPAINLVFFLHAQATYNSIVQSQILRTIDADASIDISQKIEMKKKFTEIPPSTLVRNPKAAEMFPVEVRNDFKTFHWMILLSILSIGLTIITFLSVGGCVALSFSSQAIQYYSLSIGFQLLRLVGVLLTIAQGIMLVALSYWVTALWFERFIPKLIFIVALVVFIACLVVLKSFFTRIKSDIELQGVKIEPNRAPKMWARLRSMCDALGTAPPQTMVAGIDENFFVTEQPIIANGNKIAGKTLFVSLPLLKILSGREADAVLAHEMAHFSGSDTYYSRKISPLLTRYGLYLQALGSSAASLPVFHYMNCFRALYELSLGRKSREREFRADALAVQHTSPEDLATALLRIVSYSLYRHRVQNEIFDQQEILDEANVCDMIENGYDDYVAKFSQSCNIDDLQTTHPFDSHPSMATRFSAIGIPLERSQIASLLHRHVDSTWFDEIDYAPDVERAMWDEFEEKFRQYHEESLPYRLLPASESQRSIVEKKFPPVSYEEKAGTLSITCDQFTHTGWDAPVALSDLKSVSFNEGTFTLEFTEKARKRIVITTSKFKTNAKAVTEAIQGYYGRYVMAKQYQDSRIAASQLAEQGHLTS